MQSGKLVLEDNVLEDKLRKGPLATGQNTNLLLHPARYFLLDPTVSEDRELETETESLCRKISHLASPGCSLRWRKAENCIKLENATCAAAAVGGMEARRLDASAQ